MELTDDELATLYDLLENETLYGDDEIVYGDGEDAVNLRSILTKVEHEIKARRRRR